MGRIIPYIMENEKSLKPPTSFPWQSVWDENLNIDLPWLRVSSKSPMPLISSGSTWNPETCTGRARPHRPAGCIRCCGIGKSWVLIQYHLALWCFHVFWYTNSIIGRELGKRSKIAWDTLYTQHLPVKTQCFAHFGISCELGNRKKKHVTGDTQVACTCKITLWKGNVLRTKWDGRQTGCVYLWKGNVFFLAQIGIRSATCRQMFPPPNMPQAYVSATAGYFTPSGATSSCSVIRRHVLKCAAQSTTNLLCAPAPIIVQIGHGPLLPVLLVHPLHCCHFFFKSCSNVFPALPNVRRLPHMGDVKHFRRVICRLNTCRRHTLRLALHTPPSGQMPEGTRLEWLTCQHLLLML